MITLIKYHPAFGLPDPSPFCLKAEILLKLAGVPYRVEPVNDPGRGPKGKLPAIVDGGTTLGDSELIRLHLERTTGIDFDAGLSPAERAVAHAFARMLEERTYWVGVYMRWIEPAAWAVVRETFFGGLPPVVRSLVPMLVQRRIRRTLHLQGLGRHSRDEIYGFGIADFRAVAAHLADRPYFMGSRPTAVDATVYAMIAAIVVPDFASPLKDEALRHANLVAYERRMRAQFWGAPVAAAA
ncbi:MAG: glutathione S-transferase family protein [Alphaproteobacteria bacterium]|nr:glutathione S-transferase family protein [Alphaproteobacteria bacterium]